MEFLLPILATIESLFLVILNLFLYFFKAIFEEQDICRKKWSLILNVFDYILLSLF